jgi:hypothetical protein
LKIYHTLFVLLCCIAFPSYAQVLTGVVADGDDSTLAGIVIQNKTHLQSIMSDANGGYSITAYKNDIIEFSFLGYYPYSMLMPEDGKVTRKIVLIKKAFTLDEVVIGPQYTPYQLDSIERRQLYKGALSRGFASSSTLGAIFSPASALAEQFNKESKQIARFQKNYVKWESQRFIDTRYSFEEVGQLTGLTGDTLAAFINAYPMANDFARTATDMEIKMWVKYNYREWIKKPIVLPPPVNITNTETDSLKKP